MTERSAWLTAAAPRLTGPPRRARCGAPPRSRLATGAREPPAGGRATITKSCPGRTDSAFEGLAQQPLDAVALDGAPELAADRHAESGVVVVLCARKGIDDEVAAGMRTALAVDALELTAAGQLRRFRRARSAIASRG